MNPQNILMISYTYEGKFCRTTPDFHRPFFLGGWREGVLPSEEVGQGRAYLFASFIQVNIQDKTNPAKAGKWTKTGIVTENLGFQNYEVKVHGSNNLSSRHRTHLRKIVPYTSSQLQADQYATATLPPPIQYPSTPPPIQPPPITVPETSSPPPSPPVPAPPRPHTRRPIKEKWIMTPSSEDIRKLKAQTPINVDTAQP